MKISDPLLTRIVPRIADVPGVVAIALGGSRARGAATDASDYDLGLYYGPEKPLDVNALRRVVSDLVDNAASVTVTSVGEWGPRIVGGAWLTIGGQKVDLLYREIAAVESSIAECRAGRVAMSYQPGHPHGFCSAIWMGEVATCVPLHDADGVIAGLKAQATPYPDPLADALVGMFLWEVSFSIANGQTAVARGDETHIAGCAYRALACIGQVLFALNRRYLINEKGALKEAAVFPHTLRGLTNRVAGIWAAIGAREFGAALVALRALETELRLKIQAGA
ncbi:nucleotidyltransferase domain-containing protein [Roseiarcus sp.]|uniref:nucleotidyltransferase domain-containing protein n=1 Tax=Roseiarcus sp. TaxID=1969460 RepID=UPI003F9E1F10